MAPDTAFTERRSARVALRRFRPEDAATLAAYRSDPEVARHQGWHPPFHVEQAERFIASLDGEHPDTPGVWFQLALVELTTGSHVGDVGLHVDDDGRTATVGITLARQAQGRGLATEAVTLLLDYLFLERGKHRVIADCDPRNHAVVALLERVGMRREAHHRESHWDGTAWTDEDVYAVLAGEWRDVRRGTAVQDTRRASPPSKLRAVAAVLLAVPAVALSAFVAYAGFDLATTDYVGYEVGLARLVAVATALLAVLAWTGVVVLHRSARRGR